MVALRNAPREHIVLGDSKKALCGIKPNYLWFQRIQDLGEQLPTPSHGYCLRCEARRQRLQTARA